MAWTPLEFTRVARTLTRTPKCINVNGKKLALFWDAKKDVPVIADDTCAHRGASLSAGGLVEAGCVACKYHGRRTRGVPAMHRDGIVWLRGAGTAPELPPTSWEFAAEQQRVFEYSRTCVGCNPVLLVENTLDFSHLDTVHAFHLIEGRPEVTVERGGCNGKASYKYQSKSFDLTIENEYRGPWDTCLRFVFDGRQSFTLHFSVRPEAVDRATLFVRVSRQDNVWLGALGDALYTWINELPLVEDMYIVRNTDPTQWSKNALTADDAFLKRYREYMTGAHADILDAYVQ